MAAFIILILFNRGVEEKIIAGELNENMETDPSDLFVEKEEEEEAPFAYRDVLIDREVGRDRLGGVILNGGRDSLIVDNNGVDHIAVVENLNRGTGGVILEDERGSIAYKDRRIIADQDLIYENHHSNDLLLGNDSHHGSTVRGNHDRDRVNTRGSVKDTEDHGILDRRLFERDEEVGAVDLGAMDRAIAESREKEGLDDELLGLTLARKDDVDFELDLDELNTEDKGSKNGSAKGGQLYAYNYPSQGIGAGIGSGAVGAGAGGGAGLGAGIGEAVAEGETVPTLGGIGTYSSIETVPPGTGSDGDSDGLTAEAEVILGTDPSKSDSDGDGYSDGAEVASYTNPNNPSSNPGVPGSTASPSLGGVGGLVGGAGAGGAAGLVTGMVKKPLGIGLGVGKGGCAEHGANCRGHHGHGAHDYDLPPDGALHIMMHVDGSGSILNTRKQLEIMRDTLLKNALLPYYNNDESLYNKRVTIVDGNGERTLQFFAEATKKDNVLAIVFQDEAQPSYHLPTFNKKPQDHYSKDLQSLKGGLSGYGGLYRGVMFQVDRGRTFAKSFKEFVESAWQGTGYLENSNLRKYYWEENKGSIKNKDGIVFSDEYHAKDSGDPQYYLKLILDASRKVGLNLQAKGAGLTDGTYNKTTSE